MSGTGTFRGTPTRGGERRPLPQFSNSPSSIPVPTGSSNAGSAAPSSNADTGTLSASRQKQTKRDEVGRDMLNHSLKSFNGSVD
jgi:hypothetical protein